MTTKFEVGKKYRLTAQKHDHQWPCVFSGKDYAILEDASSWPVVVGHNGGALDSTLYWEEVKPLTFADLKPGEKFKWVKPRDSGEVICIKVKPISGRISFHTDTPREFGWVPLSGDKPGFIFIGEGPHDEVVRVP